MQYRNILTSKAGDFDFFFFTTTQIFLLIENYDKGLEKILISHSIFELSR